MIDDSQPPEIQEGLRIIRNFYGFDRPGDDQYLMKTSFREDAYRMVVIELHLAIEDVLKYHLYQVIAQKRTFNAKQNKKYIKDMSFKNMIDLCARLGIIPKKTYKDLRELNSVRNECAHSWLLGTWRVARIAGTRKRRYAVEFYGKNLLTPKVLEDEFLPLYSKIYLKYI